MTRWRSGFGGILIVLGVATCLSVGLAQGVPASPTGDLDWLLVFLWPVFSGFLAFAYFSWRSLAGRRGHVDRSPTELPAGLLPPRREAIVDCDDLDDPNAFAMVHYNVCLSDLAAGGGRHTAS
ncbi:hypothetical protein [Rhodococcus daqingensis]|uniref:Transcriptional regulator n=1 Tax=Rhodococcus daqingensis TaxID=2479363 RepID=A0ABW2RSY2_9NOCA